METSKKDKLPIDQCNQPLKVMQHEGHLMCFSMPWPAAWGAKLVVLCALALSLPGLKTVCFGEEVVQMFVPLCKCLLDLHT